MSARRIIASPRPMALEQPGTAPIYDSPSCPYCDQPLDVVGVDTVLQGGGGEATAVALSCPCGYGFEFNPPSRTATSRAGDGGG